MRQRLLFYTIIIMACLKAVLKTIRDHEPNVNQREALVKTVLLAPKLANNLDRISFLVRCRKAQVFPRFIQDIISRTAIISSKGTSFEAKKRRFSRDMLNEAIQESYRKQAFLRREQRRLEEEATQATRSDFWMWLQDQCRSIFTTCRQENRRKLASKFERLLANNSDKVDDSCPSGQED